MKNTRVNTWTFLLLGLVYRKHSINVGPCSSASAFLKQFFIYFQLCWLFVAVLGLSVVATSRGYSLGVMHGFSLQGLLLLQSMGSQVLGLW